MGPCITLFPHMPCNTSLAPTLQKPSDHVICFLAFLSPKEHCDDVVSATCEEAWLAKGKEEKEGAT